MYCPCKAFSVGPGLHDTVLQRSAAGETYAIPVHTCLSVFISVYQFVHPFIYNFCLFMYSLGLFSFSFFTFQT